MDSRGLIEFVYGDGCVVTGVYEDFAERHLTQGAAIEFDEAAWVMYDRVDRGGVTVYLCRPVHDQDAPGLTALDGGGESAGVRGLAAVVARLQEVEQPARHLHVVR